MSAVLPRASAPGRHTSRPVDRRRGPVGPGSSGLLLPDLELVEAPVHAALAEEAEDETFCGVFATDHGVVEFDERDGSSLVLGNGNLSASYYGSIRLGCEEARVTSWTKSNNLAINNGGRIDLRNTPTVLRAQLRNNVPIGLEHDGHILAEDAHIDALFRVCESRIHELLPACPERRDLIHGDLLHQNVLVSEDEIKEAMRLFMASHHMMIEGAAGVAIASFLKMKDQFKGKNVVVIICGANISLKTLAAILNSPDSRING